jgi:hypothetical protein
MALTGPVKEHQICLDQLLNRFDVLLSLGKRVRLAAEGVLAFALIGRELYLAPPNFEDGTSHSQRKEFVSV